jgi:hypothetical protein
MSVTHPRPALSRYQDAIMDRMNAGESFGDVEDAIDIADLTEDEKAALWLLAFSMRDPRDQRRDARAYLTHLAYA